MVINYYKMSGDELKRIYKISGLEADEFAEKLGIKRHQLYTQFARRNRSIDADVETALKGNADLAKHQHLSTVSRSDSKDVAEAPSFGPSSELVGKVIDMLQETLMLVKNQSAVIADDNRVIKEHAAIFSQLVKQGADDGILVFKKSR